MGSSGSTPDIRVKLTADGVQQVIQAFRQVNQEAKNIQPGGVSLLTNAFKDLQALLPAISLGLIVQQVVQLGTEALATAENLVRMSQRTGVSAGTLSVFGLAAKETGVDMDAVGMAITRLDKAQADAANGAAKPKKAFESLGITFQQLKTLTPDQLMVLVANKLSAIESPATRAQTAINLFGKAGAQLIPLLNRIADEGFGNLEEKAKRLGVYLGEDFEEKARLAQISMGDLSAAVQGAAMQFVNGAIPAVSGLAAALSALAGGGDGFFKLGQSIGAGVIYITSGFVSLVKEITIAGATFDLFATKARTAVDGVGALNAFTSGARAKFSADYSADLDRQGEDKNTINQAKIDAAQSQAALDKSFAALYAPAKPDQPNRGGRGVDGNGEKPAKPVDQDKIDAAEAAYLQAKADNEIAILKTRNQIEESEDKRSYDAGLLTLDDYYNSRADRIAKTSNAEEAVLEQKLVTAQSLPQSDPEKVFKRLTQIGKVQTEITNEQLKSDSDLRANEEERLAARFANAEKELGITKQLQQAAGDKDAAAETGLLIEIAAYEKLLRTQGLSEAAINAETSAYKKRGEAKIAFDENQKNASSVSEDYASANALVDAQVGSGRITSYAGDVEKLQFQQEELVKLQAIGAQLTLNAAASGDQTAVDTAKKFNDSLVIQAEKLKNVTTATVYLKNELSTAGTAALGTFFFSIIDGSKTAGQALSDLGKSFEQIISGMISKLFVFYALEAVVGFISPGSDLSKSLDASGPFGKFQGGGYTGNAPVDKVAGIVHGQEYVFDAATTSKNRALFEAISSGTVNLASTVSSGMNMGSIRPANLSYATGSNPEDAAGGSTPVQVIVNNYTGQPVQQSKSKGSDGGDIITLVLGKVAQDITGNGKVGQAIITTFGSVRQGTKR